jgi:SH3 domain protein
MYANKTLFATLMLCTLAAPPLAAETLYVTDELRLGMFENRDQTGRRIKLLSSGDAVEILERDSLYARVQGPEGVEGWVKVGFLVAEKPAALRVREVEEESARLRVELNRARASDAAQRVTQLEDELASLRAEHESATAAVAEQSAELESLRELKSDVTEARAQTGLWIILAALGGLAVGAYAGYAVYARRLRQRFSGLSLG